MALELFNTATKHDVYNNWYPLDTKQHVRFIVREIQEKHGKSKTDKFLRKDVIKDIIKHFGKPVHIDDDDYDDYIEFLKKHGEW